MHHSLFLVGLALTTLVVGCGGSSSDPMRRAVRLRVEAQAAEPRAAPRGAASLRAAAPAARPIGEALVAQPVFRKPGAPATAAAATVAAQGKAGTALVEPLACKVARVAPKVVAERQAIAEALEVLAAPSAQAVRAECRARVVSRAPVKATTTAQALG